MAARPMSAEQLQAAADLVAAHGGNVVAAARAAGLAPPTLQYRIARARAAGVTASRAPGAAPLPMTADEAWRVLDRAIGRSAKVVTLPPARTGTRERIVIAGDFHAPFHEPELVATLIARERGRADRLVINGDLIDFYSISRFTKYEAIGVEAELGAADAVLGQLAAAFPAVVLVCGNHDRPRFERQLRSLLSVDLLRVIEFLTGGTLDPIAVLARRYPNVTIARHEVGRYAIGWVYQVGDLLCAHAEKFSRVPGTALRAISEWLADRRDVLGLRPWRVLVQAHTHQLGLFPWQADQVLIEGGCMCQVHGYQLDAKIAGRPQRRGYVALEQVHGITDVNSVEVFWWDQR